MIYIYIYGINIDIKRDVTFLKTHSDVRLSHITVTARLRGAPPNYVQPRAALWSQTVEGFRLANKLSINKHQAELKRRGF